jgi:two-component system response regulator AlgR
VLIVNDRGRLLRLPLAELLYLKAELKYVTVRTAERSYVLDDALSDLEQRLGDAFLRVHRNALVARRAVRELARRAEPEAESEGGEGWAVRVAPADEWLAVSRRQLAAVRQALAAPD